MRALPFFLDMAGLALIILFGVTQLILPAWKGTKLFPFFRRKRSRLEEELVEVREEKELHELEQNLQKEKESK